MGSPLACSIDIRFRTGLSGLLSAAITALVSRQIIGRSCRRVIGRHLRLLAPLRHERSGLIAKASSLANHAATSNFSGSNRTPSPPGDPHLAAWKPELFRNRTAGCGRA